ncbi:hypothetical protein EV421DRAFT_1741775 [Armillaria borealis]|uniref:Uncharacterized protein n=1 Tax=Armillaria borealis TaxID=47425 RepID=A0AA39MH06_9AGAR|nr:hypothetical protein EV421DRAFT_1741775 [Armillaria borealis]
MAALFYTLVLFHPLVAYLLLATLMSSSVQALYESPSSSFLPTLSTGDVLLGPDGVYQLVSDDVSSFIAFGYLGGEFQSRGWCTLIRGPGFTPDGVLYDNQIRLLLALARRDMSKADTPFISWVLHSASPRILVYIDYATLSIRAPWGEGPGGLLPPGAVSSQSALLKEAFIAVVSSLEIVPV